MKLKSLKNKIIKLGGTAEIEQITSEYIEGYGYVLEGFLNDCTIQMKPNFGSDETDYFIVLRPNTEYDPGSDYNPNGYIFCHRIADLEWACKLPQTGATIVDNVKVLEATHTTLKY